MQSKIVSLQRTSTRSSVRHQSIPRLFRKQHQHSWTLTDSHTSPPHCARKRRCSSSATKGKRNDEDEAYMQQALELARRGLGKTEPNPAVGCVIVKDGKVIGEGFHPKAGEPHAEIFALRAAGQAAEGATAYVTLEPCNHYGKTPPCSQALVAAKVSRVVVGVGDPNPLVGGQGIKTLEKAGIEVLILGGDLEKDCYDLNAAFMRKMEAAG